MVVAIIPSKAPFKTYVESVLANSLRRLTMPAAQSADSGIDTAPNIEEARRRIAQAATAGLEELDLGGLNLCDVPEEVFALTQLKRFYMGRERTGGSAPTSLGGGARNRLATINPRLFTSLTKLETLDLAANELTSLPIEVASLQALEALFLGSNALASLPEEIGSLQYLSQLDVTANNLTALPAGVCRCRKLVFLNIMGNKLTSLPPEIGARDALQEFVLDGNQLSLLPPEVGQLSSLEVLSIRGHQTPAKVGLTALPPEVGRLTRP
jgi:Leucine-rich repeat (LRR) protein